MQTQGSSPFTASTYNAPVSYGGPMSYGTQLYAAPSYTNAQMSPSNSYAQGGQQHYQQPHGQGFGGQAYPPQQQGYTASPFSPPGGTPFQPPGQQFPPQAGLPYQQPFHGAGSRNFSAGGSIAGSQVGQQAAGGEFPPRTSLPTAPGLPQKPNFAVPSVNQYDMQKMHSGQYDGAQASQDPISAQNGKGKSRANGTESVPDHATSVDDLISSAAKDAEAAVTTTNNANSQSEAPRQKKAKNTNIKLVYTDNDTSPEEKMFKMPKYTFSPNQTEEIVLGEPTAAVTGVVGTINDPSG